MRPHHVCVAWRHDLISRDDAEFNTQKAVESALEPYMGGIHDTWDSGDERDLK